MQRLTYMPTLKGVTNKNESYAHPINLIEAGSTDLKNIQDSVIFQTN